MFITVELSVLSPFLLAENFTDSTGLGNENECHISCLSHSTLSLCVHVNAKQQCSPHLVYPDFRQQTAEGATALDILQCRTEGRLLHTSLEHSLANLLKLTEMKSCD